MCRLARPALLVAATVAMAACASSAADAPLHGFLSDPARRRAALSGTLWFQDNEYARRRLERYVTGLPNSWEALPEWLPACTPVRSGPGSQAVLPLPALANDSEAALATALVRLGEVAFFDYPVQLVGGFEVLVRSPELLPAYGLWTARAPTDAADAAPRLGGLLRVELPGSGGTALALSCASCHAQEDGERIEPGRPAARLDIGALAQDQAPPGVVLPQARWGPGRVDVSPDGVDNPVVIPDLRVVTAQRYFHHEATLRNQDGAGVPLGLAARIETLLITNLEEQARPPPAVALGLALYLRSLAKAPSPLPSGRGQEVFAVTCQGCHAPPDYAGEPVPLTAIGTDPAAGQSPERGTLSYRTPTLRAVSERPALLHDGQLRDLASLLDPARLDGGYQGGLHRAGPVPGHLYGLQLSASDRSALLAFLQRL